jgi:hypothetical protein
VNGCQLPVIHQQQAVNSVGDARPCRAA